MKEMHDCELVLANRGVAKSIFGEITLRGFDKISKVSFTKSALYFNRWFYDQVTVAYKNWIIETDGVDLHNILALESIYNIKTTSNSFTEMLQVLGIEANRMSLLHELRVILSYNDIYVNYRNS
jgi:hypothetical protein